MWHSSSVAHFVRRSWPNSQCSRRDLAKKFSRVSTNSQNINGSGSSICGFSNIIVSSCFWENSLIVKNTPRSFFKWLKSLLTTELAVALFNALFFFVLPLFFDDLLKFLKFLKFFIGGRTSPPPQIFSVIKQI
jgi:hypothetical protein